MRHALPNSRPDTGHALPTSTCSSLTASFKYDALGRRIEKSVTDTVNGTRTTNYLYDGLDIIGEVENGVPSAMYMRTLNIDEPLMRIKRDGTIRHYKQDALGSVIGLLDDTGIPKTGYTYDPFGNVTILGEPSDNPFQYTGRENDNTGLYYYRARYYSPELQRFISEDPIGFNGGSINLYEYVGNNPINYTDPKGLAYISGLGNICKTLYPNNTYVDRCFRKACMECIASGFGGGIPYMSSLFGFCITIKGTYNYYTGNCDCP